MVLGPSGTGKSVLIKHIVGLLYPDSGDVLVHGESVPNMTDDELFEVRKKFGLLFQDGALFGSMNIYDNVAFPLRQHTDKGEDEIGEIVTRRLREVGLGEAHYKMPNELSGGMRKRAGFARALVLDPAIVMFDEPDSGLDPVRTALLCELIREVHEENGGCYMVISHDLGTARRIADFIAVLWKGKIVESGPKEELFNSTTSSSASSSTRTSRARSRWTERASRRRPAYPLRKHSLPSPCWSGDRHTRCGKHSLPSRVCRSPQPTRRVDRIRDYESWTTKLPCVKGIEPGLGPQAPDGGGAPKVKLANQASVSPLM
jgi:phospholipid/cholesterol/gamma-HCH transport system ATP-binding protein